MKNNNSEKLLNEKYLPFTKEDFLKHFANVKGDKCSNSKEKHLKYYTSSIDNYNKYLESEPKEKRLDKLRKPRQIEKDERFWTASSLMTLFYSADMVKEFTNLFSKAYGDKPPININSWEDCFSGNRNKDIHLFFEANLPSPLLYKNWLQQNIKERQFIPYILNCAFDEIKKEFRGDMEGPTNVDAILINSKNGFSVIVEAKVLSDISISITYDSMRNQLARNIDVMLELNDNLCEPLNKRDPEKTLFLLITPELFKKNPKSRLYGYKINEYKSSPNSLFKDLPHRKDIDNWMEIANRIGWLSWKEFKEVNQNCCLWLDDLNKSKR
jgi:hypothetical protein